MKIVSIDEKRLDREGEFFSIHFYVAPNFSVMDISGDTPEWFTTSDMLVCVKRLQTILEAQIDRENQERQVRSVVLNTDP